MLTTISSKGSTKIPRVKKSVDKQLTGLALGIAGVLLASLARLALSPLWGPTEFPFIFFYPVVALAAWYGRIRPALVTILLSAVMAKFFFIAHPYSFYPLDVSSFVGILSFAGVSLVIAIAIEAMHRAKARVQHELKERLETEQALNKKEAELQLIVNETPFMLTHCSADLRYYFVSPAYAEMLGRPAHEINGKPIREIMGEAGLKTIQPYIQKVLEGEVVEFEAEVPFPRVGRRFLHVVYTPDNNGGNVTGWIASIRDITESKRTQLSLAESLRREQVMHRFVDGIHRAETEERIYEVALESIVGGLSCDRASILLFDESEVMRFVASRALSDEYKQAVEGHSPWTANDIEAKPISIADIDNAELEEPLRQVIKKEGIRALHFIPLIAGQRVIGKFMFYFDKPHSCGNEEMELALNIGRQLAFAIARKRTDSALRENEERLRLATQTGKVGIWDWDITSNQVHWTDSLYEVHGLDKGTFGGTVESFASLVHPEDRERISEALERSLNHNEPYELEFRALKPNGDLVWLFTSALVFSNGHKATRMLGATIDITEAKSAEAGKEALFAREQELRQAAEESNRLKDEFLAIMSHELRNPLNVILGYSELLVRSKEISELPRLQQMTQAIRRNAVTQSKLIRDLLDLSRLRSGKLVLNREVVSAMMSVNNAVDTVRDEAVAKNILISVSASDESLLVDADPVRLEQIVWNLLNNAVKFTPVGGQIVIELGLRDSKVCVTVRDTGQGIDPSFLPHIFEIFRQADMGTMRAQTGMGIGLAVVRQLAELHGGEVFADSGGLGKGAEFRVTLPLSTNPAKTPAHAARPTEHVLANLRVLVLDDSEDTAQMLQSLLSLSGAMVVATTNGGDALRIAGETDFDVILSDISMPGMDGFEFLRNIKQSSRNARIPVFALTGFGREEDIQRARAVGFYSHLTKPLDVDILMKALKDLPRGVS